MSWLRDAHAVDVPSLLIRELPMPKRMMSDLQPELLLQLCQEILRCSEDLWQHCCRTPAIWANDLVILKPTMP